MASFLGINSLVSRGYITTILKQTGFLIFQRYGAKLPGPFKTYATHGA